MRILKDRRFFFSIVIVVVGILAVLTAAVFIYRKAESGKRFSSEESGDKVRQPTAFEIQSKTDSFDYTAEEAEMAQKATTRELAIKENGVDFSEVTIGFHDTVIFRNTTDKKVTVSFEPDRSVEIPPGDFWGRSFEALETYEYKIDNLASPFLGKITVTK